MAPSLVSEDGVWKIFYDEFGQVACKKIGTNRGWYLGCKDVDSRAAALAEQKIKGYTTGQYDHIT